MDEALGWTIAAGVCYCAYRLLFGSSTRRRQVPQASVDQITSMFPNVSQHAARWELERNGGSVERAVERALREGGLPEPPASYNPPSAEAPRATGPVPPTTPVRAAPAPQASTPAGAGARGKPPSLIARMGLQAQVAADVKGRGKATDEDTGFSSGWSPKAEEREKNLRARKEKLVLEARRKMLEKTAKKQADAAAEAAIS
ncbi:hypothetical protein JCM8202_005652 [Rhodotorula sphaerocarpa]